MPDEDQGFVIVIAAGAEGVSLDYTDRVSARSKRSCGSSPKSPTSSTSSASASRGNGSQQSDDVRAPQAVERTPGREHTRQCGARARQPAAVHGLSLGGAGLRVQSAVDPGARLPGRLRVRARGPREPGHPAALRAAYRSSVRRNAPTSALSQRLHDVPHRQAARQRRRRPRQGAEPRCPARQPLQHDAGLSGLGLRQRLRPQPQSYRVYVQADAPYRSRIADLSRSTSAVQRR